MGFKTVYRMLMDVFPQVDNRILRAVAIENSKDADKAAEVVLTEVIPNIASNLASVDNYIDNNASNEDDTVRRDSEKLNENVGLLNYFSSDDKNGSGGQVCEPDEKQIVSPVKLRKINGHIPSTLGPSSISNYEDVPHYQFLNSLDLNTSPVRLNNTSESIHEKATILNYEDLPTNLESQVESNLEQLCSNVTSPVLDCPSLGSENSLQQASVNVPEETHNSHAISVNYITAIGVDDFENEPTEEKSTHELVDFELEYTEEKPNCEVVEFEHEHALKAEVSQSGNICRIDLLEDIIKEARENKKTLNSALDSIISLMRGVKIKEKEAEQLKEEAARGPLDILTSVEDLKQMLLHAREANNMHAGEVYGEKAILATEVKELQSRLLCLSEERNKSLAILDEIRQTLERRLDAAEKEMKAAKEEKIEKEERARNTLAEQQLLMDKLVQESKMLKQEAEENSKLQEFLMDRGRVVDTLQGEISVICQDVKLLKQKFDERVPLSESLPSSQTSCRLASSSSSLKSLPLDHVPMHIETLEKTSPSPYISDHSSSGEEIEAKDDDGWEFFDKKELNL